MEFEEYLSYEVHRCDYGAWVMGDLADGEEISGLVRAWHHRGWKYMSRKVARKLDALVAFCKGVVDEKEWLEQLNLSETSNSDLTGVQTPGNLLAPGECHE